MASYTFLKNLILGKDNDCIKVRVTREWQVKSSDNKYVVSKNYILLDEEGTQIQASPLENSLIKLFTKKLELGQVYMISTYNVVPAYPAYRAVQGEFVIKFHRNTVTKELTNISILAIPMYKFQLIDFEKVKEKIDETKDLMDVVGKLLKVSDWQTTKRGKKMIEILLANERDDNMKITLWENQASMFLECEAEYMKPNVILIVTSTSAKSMQGETVLWSSSSTQFFFNIEHPNVMELRKNYKTDKDLITAVVPVVQSQQQTLVQPVERATIAQLSNAQLPDGKNIILFTSEVTVNGINLERGWYYIGCQKCQKTMPPWMKCVRCKDTTAAIPLYRVKAEVSDSTSETTIVLFERHVLKMINVSAEHILNNDPNASQDVIPAVLNNILGRRYLFKLSLDRKNTVDKLEGYTVSDVLEEITREDPLPDTSGTTTQSQKSNQDNDQLNDDIQKKRKLAIQEKNIEILDETDKVLPEATCGHKNINESSQSTSQEMSHLTTKGGNVKEHRDKRQK